MSPKVQRIGILVIAIVMLVGTIGTYAMMILTNENTQAETEQQAEAQQKALEEQQKQTDELAAKADELSDKYYPVFKKYEDAPESFDADSVGEKVTHRDLKEGTGETIADDSKYLAYYIGWNPKGNSFDSSFADDGLKPPLDTGQIQLISGWYEGVKGMKVGGIREITIPSDLAYGETDMGADLPPNTPIKFIVMVAEKS